MVAGFHFELRGRDGSRGDMVVKNTFLELFYETLSAKPMRRVCSDPALYQHVVQSAGRANDLPDLSGGVHQEPGTDDVVCTAPLSDAETEPDAPWLYLTASSSSSESAGYSVGGAPDGGTTADVQFQRQQIDGMISANTLLERENEILRHMSVAIEADRSQMFTVPPQMPYHNQAPTDLWAAAAPHSVTEPSQLEAAPRGSQGRGRGRRKTNDAASGSAAGRQCHQEASAPQLSERPRRRIGEDATTVILRNIPNNYTRHMFLHMLDSAGFCGAYDFAYLPVDFSRQASLGYAFVNLVSPSLVQNFWTYFDGFKRWSLPTRKVCKVDWAGPIQGLQAHIDRFRDSPVMHESVPDEFKPVIFKDGVPVEFPASTSRGPAAPRVRAGGHRREQMSTRRLGQAGRR